MRYKFIVANLFLLSVVASANSSDALSGGAYNLSGTWSGYTEFCYSNSATEAFTENMRCMPCQMKMSILDKEGELVIGARPI